MNNIQNLVVLDKTVLEEKIRFLNSRRELHITDDEYYYDRGKQSMLKELLLEQSKPLEPIVSEQIILGQIEVLEECNIPTNAMGKAVSIENKIQELKAKLK